MMRALVAVALASGTAMAGSHCHETSPIVGRRHCGAFGTRWAHHWINDLLAIDLGIAYDHVHLASLDQTGTLSSSSTTASYHATLGPGHTLSALGPRYSLGFRGEHVIVRGEVTIAFGIDAPRSTTQVDGFAPLTSSSATLFDGAGVLGLQTRAGPLELGAQVALGVRSISLPQHVPDGFTTCAGGATGKSCGLGLASDSLLVEPRLRADLWLSSQLTLALTAGYDVIERGESFAVTLSVHGSPFDGS